MKKILFIDRDGTIIAEPGDEQVDSLEKLSFIPGVISALASVCRELEYDLVLVTNQDGLGTGSFPEETFWPAHNKMLNTLEGEGIRFSEILIDKTFPSDMAETRKPRTGMVRHYIRGEYDLENSFVIGDRVTDIEFAENIGCKAIWFNNELSDRAVLSTTNWNAIYRYLKERPRTARRHRKTNETEIDIYLNLDGTGKREINTGIGFFDHMLDQVSKHSGIDLIINAKGDLHTDEHHTIEDVGITFGEAINEALGYKKGISRYGFLLPMDDSLAQIAIDFGGRPWLVWEASFTREMIGNMPSEMFFHFFKSFSDGARCNLNIKASGENEHHKAESVFKALGKALQMAVKRDNTGSIPSTKGSL